MRFKSIFTSVAGLLAAAALSGCGSASIVDPAGTVGMEQRTILFDSLLIMLAIILPTIAATFFAAWWFRESNTRAKYRPNWTFSEALEVIVWGIPVLTIMLLGGVTWVSSHDLDPAKPLASKQAPLEIQGVSMDWKWLFIYPGSNIASLNELVIPQGVPVHFALTSSSVLNSFFVPKLGSQIYTMNGMATALNLVADQPGTYHGLGSHYSGDGFSDMNFPVRAVTAEQFGDWVTKAQSVSGARLDRAAYEELAKPSEKLPAKIYHDIEPGLFAKIVSQEIPPAPGPLGTVTVASGAPHKMEH